MNDNFNPSNVCPNSDGICDNVSDNKRFIIPIFKVFGKRSFAYMGYSLWNNLPQYIRDSGTTSAFKSRVKEHFYSPFSFYNSIVLNMSVYFHIFR